MYAVQKKFHKIGLKEGRRWPEKMKDEPLWKSNCAVESISNLINTAL